MPNYDYTDELGEVVNRVVKYGNKNFRQEHLDESGTWVSGRGDNRYPYHLVDVLEAIDQGHPVWVMEGEGDVESAYLNGLVATTNSGGAGKWTDEHSKWLIAAEPVFICFDDDQQGIRHALKVEASLRRVGISDIRFRKARSGKDFTDHINAGHEVSDLIKVRKASLRTDDVTEEQAAEEASAESSTSSAFQLALIRLKKVKPEYGKENQYTAACPAHNDVRPSLSIRAGGPDDDVAVLVTCHANGCAPADIARALDIPPIEFTTVPRRYEKGTQEYANEQALVRKRANRHADKMLAKESLAHIREFGDRSETGLDELAIPLEPIKWTIDQWFRYGTKVQLIAEPKAGKTRLAMNMIKALTEDEPFLGIYQTSWPEDARIWYGNYDMPDDLFREYLHDYEWKKPDSFIVEHLAGQEFPFWIPDVFDDFVQYALRMNIQMIIIDTMHIASQGAVSNEWSNDEMSEFISLLKKLCDVAKIPHLFVIHHPGHGDKTRGRGASSQAADFDNVWALSMEGEEFDSPRTLKSRGRKAGVASVTLAYNVDTECYTTDLGQRVVGYGDRAKIRFDREVAKRIDYMRALIAFEQENGRPARVREGLKLYPGKNAARSAGMALCEELGLVVRRQQEKGATLSVSPSGVAFLSREV